MVELRLVSGLAGEERNTFEDGVIYECLYILTAVYVSFHPFHIRRYVAGYSVPKLLSQVSILKTSGDSYTVTLCQIAKEYDFHAFVYETQNSLLIFSPFYCK